MRSSLTDFSEIAHLYVITTSALSIPSPMSNLSLNDIHFTYLLPFGFSCKNASSIRNWNCLVFWSVLNPQHLEDSMAYNWLPLNISWVNGSTSMISIAIFIWFPICSFSLVLFPKFKIYIFNCLFESPQNISDSAYLRLNSLSCLPISPHHPLCLLQSYIISSMVIINHLSRYQMKNTEIIPHRFLLLDP